MITIREFRNMIHQCPEDWNMLMQKWEHGDPNEFMKRNHYPMPNLVSVKIQDITSRYNDESGKIFTIILEDNFDDDFIMTPKEYENLFCEGKDDYDLLDFVLYVEENGKYDHIPLLVSIGDKGYSDKVIIIDLEEKI